MDPVAAAWFSRRTWQRASWPVEELVAAKAGRSVSVVLPALNEESTVGHVVEAVSAHLGLLVDEIVVMDGGSSDATGERARAAGARVVRLDEVLPELPVRPGKGEVLWRSLRATSSEVLVFVDADLVDVDSGLVPGLLGPLLTEDGVHLVKGFYRRPLRLETAEAGTGGGRVTELVARPLLATFVPELSGVVQPLGGEYAATRALLESLPFAGAYGVEIGLLIDTWRSHGLDALAQVDLGVRKHRNRTLLELGVMAEQVLETVLRRMAPAATRPQARVLTQFEQVDGVWAPRHTLVRLGEREPMRDRFSPAAGAVLGQRAAQVSDDL
jgi:glucosyl-3-phosphoglycerate synthase